MDSDITGPVLLKIYLGDLLPLLVLLNSIYGKSVVTITGGNVSRQKWSLI